MPPTVVIVGASLAGASAAATLRQEGFDGDVVALKRFGQSVWLDDLRRGLFTSGGGGTSSTGSTKYASVRAVIQPYARLHAGRCHLSRSGNSNQRVS